jgi:hypothetical protein
MTFHETPAPVASWVTLFREGSRALLFPEADVRSRLNATFWTEEDHPSPEIGAEALKSMIHMCGNEEQIAGIEFKDEARAAECSRTRGDDVKLIARMWGLLV